VIRRSRGLVLAFAVVLSGTLGVGCGSEESERALTGIVRDDPLRSDGVTVTDVTDSGAYPATADTFELVARPESLLVVYFGFTNCPDICPTSLAELRVALQRIGDEAERVDLAMITVDPDRDTPEVLNGYVGSFVERYHVLRPSSPEELQIVEDAFLASSSVTTTPEGRVEVSHTATTYVVDENGVVRVELPFGHGLDNLVNDLQVLLDQVRT
jgi:protein SCO1/2